MTARKLLASRVILPFPGKQTYFAYKLLVPKTFSDIVWITVYETRSCNSDTVARARQP